MRKSCFFLSLAKYQSGVCTMDNDNGTMEQWEQWNNDNDDNGTMDTGKVGGEQ